MAGRHARLLSEGLNMAKKKIYQAFGAEITIDEAIEAAGVSRGAFYAQLSQLGGA